VQSNINKFVRDCKGLEGTKVAMDHFTEETEKAGFPGLHVPVIGFGGNELPGILQYDLMQGKTNSEVVD